MCDTEEKGIVGSERLVRSACMPALLLFAFRAVSIFGDVRYCLHVHAKRCTAKRESAKDCDGAFV